MGICYCQDKESLTTLENYCDNECVAANLSNCPSLKNLKGISKIEKILSLSKLKNLTTLKGLEEKNPKYINDIELEKIKIKNLDYLPEKVHSLYLKNLSSLENLSSNTCKKINYLIITNCNKLKNLKNSPMIGNRLIIKNCKKFESCEGLKTFDDVTQIDIIIKDNPNLQSLKDLPKIVSEFSLDIENYPKDLDCNDFPDMVLKEANLNYLTSSLFLNDLLPEFENFKIIFKKIINWNFISIGIESYDLFKIFEKMKQYYKCKQKISDDDLHILFKLFQFNKKIGTL